ncbi:MAG: asparagine synthetase B [Candidatus Poribacteria bacterium]|nr:asparagine synthetase B [Candidatus Poribacteria bacterium]
MNSAKYISLILLCLLMLASSVSTQWLLIPMDQTQTNHLKAYGLTYWTLEVPRQYDAKWLLNYRGGAFLLKDAPDVRLRAQMMGVSFQPISDLDYGGIRSEMDNSNMDEILLEKAPKIAVYAPSEDTPYRDPWDDAVKIAMEYAEIPYDTIWDKEVQTGMLYVKEYDWLHLHHEDFTGQHGKFHGAYKGQVWYQQRKHLFEQAAAEAGFDSVPKHKAHICKLIQEYVSKGGFLFAMCSAPETLDIALSTRGGSVDIVAPELDGTPLEPNYQSKLDFNPTLAFEDFTLYPNPNRYEFSNVDNPRPDLNPLSGVEDFVLFEFAAKHDPIPTMLTQNHVSRVRGFLGQTTSFNKDTIRDTVTIMGDIEGSRYAKYIHGKLGKGTFTFFGGHDPEDYRHLVGEGRVPTNLDLHKHSPGYRLLLNNILFPAAKKKPQKT